MPSSGSLSRLHQKGDYRPLTMPPFCPFLSRHIPFASISVSSSGRCTKNLAGGTMSSLSLWNLDKKGRDDVYAVTSLPERCRVWSISITTGPRTALAISPVLAAHGMEVKGVVPAHARRHPGYQSELTGLSRGLLAFWKKEYLPNASESLGPVLLGFHIWWC